MAPTKLYVKANVHILGLTPGQAGAFASDHPLHDEAKALADEGTKVEKITKAEAEDLGLVDVDEPKPAAPHTADATTAMGTS